jgi:hypothetical protein
MFHYTMLHQFQWNVASYAETLRQKENPALMRALNRYVDLVQAKQRELETRFGIMMVQPGSADEADTPLQVRESYRPMFHRRGRLHREKNATRSGGNSLPVDSERRAQAAARILFMRTGSSDKVAALRDVGGGSGKPAGDL